MCDFLGGCGGGGCVMIDMMKYDVVLIVMVDLIGEWIVCVWFVNLV